ncbi:MAG TPA: flagellar hook-associated protein 3 [Lachnoclostridium phytofermentans]|uniref:Flagellar hook-associated protein 3 n=2 Tax=Lachnoclostridium TaxID=1506553 RepID=A0A3D2X2U5_9FIRM|nr:flagellar hook-associated protein 3 [Lachnoclostridium phytofermentans]
MEISMRITNKMMTNNVLYNINNNKNSLSKTEQQYSTGKKIQRPSEDPIIAVRALKLRTNLTELNQYYEKNIPDALAWMDLTESSLRGINEILTKVHTYCVDGANDTLTEEDRNSLAVNLNQLKDQIYQEGNTNYAGRYVFSGYKTDSSLVFSENTSNYNYFLTERLSGTNLDVVQKSINSFELSSYNPNAPLDTSFDEKPNYITAHRLRLAYNDLKNLDDGQLKIEIADQDSDGNVILDGDGNRTYTEYGGIIESKLSTDDDAYTPPDGTIYFLADTGELILPEDVYQDFRDKADIKVSYEKNSFMKNDLKPEHYFDCVQTDLTSDDLVERTFTKQNQEIRYEINFSQSMVVNTQGSDSINHTIGRTIDDIIFAVNSVIEVDKKISEVKKMLESGNVTEEQRSTLNQALEVLTTEKTLKDEVMQKTFGSALTEIKGQQNIINVAVSDLGSRSLRIQLTESRLSMEQVDFEDLLSKNEDADVVDTIIKLKSQETVYNSSLSAAAKVVKNSLLDFL